MSAIEDECTMTFTILLLFFFFGSLAIIKFSRWLGPLCLFCFEDPLPYYKSSTTATSFVSVVNCFFVFGGGDKLIELQNSSITEG